MKMLLVLSLILTLISSCAIQQRNDETISLESYDDLTINADRNTVLDPNKIYRMAETGICGTVGEDYMKVTHVIPGSPADGKIMVGDILRGMQHRHMSARGGSLAATARLRLFRIGRDWDWHFYVTVERTSLRKGKGNTIVCDLHMPPAPGNVCHYGPTGFFAKRHTNHLVIEAIEKDSPADGKLMKGDIILSVDGNPISINAYHQFTKAIDRAESLKGKGELKFKVRRTGELPKGSTATSMKKENNKKKAETELSETKQPQESKELEVVLNLKVLGEYSDTTPINCKKSDAIITQAADYLSESWNMGKLNWGILGLLATGEEKYIKIAAEKIREMGNPPENPDDLLEGKMYVSWHYGYTNLVLTEYYLLTGDKYVLPKIRQLSRTLAAGQDQAGLWGHQMAKPFNGRAHGYGVMNQPSLHIFISLILAQKCGVKDDSVIEAIKRTHDHYDKWVGQGSLPYGNHGPGSNHFTNNGTSGSLAVAFALLGNVRGAKFYGAMSAAASEEILLGHGGPVWNILWTGLGANALGPEATSAYSDRVHWLRTTTRTWNGRYVSIKGWGTEIDSGDWSTGSQLLNLCTSRRKLYITGKGMPKSLWVNKEKAKEIVEAGILDTSSETALLKALGSPYPPVQSQAAKALAALDANVANKVLRLLVTGDKRERIGAIYAIQKLKIDDVTKPLLNIALNEKDDLWLRRLALGALANKADAKIHASKLLEMLVKDKPYDEPYKELDLSLGRTLLKLYEPSPYAANLNKELFYKGIIKLLNHKHKTGRSTAMRLIKMIPKEDLGRVIDKMIYIIEDKDKTYTSYCPGSGRQEALEILYRLGVKESMEYTVKTAKQGRGVEQRARMRLLKTFGGEAKYLIPLIKEILGKQADPIVKQIESATTTRKMVSANEVPQKL